ncbi:hypothetical protein Avi_2992 [Allorhizobium ampelinum S4]|uniref:Uncharacterized protein n=1 Tax=Allorhizobium ampelinum (strain ATCC BAA-846 / DSM 112012 / S4) TaxID=311402 RepID=B9JYC8_ALLAM|nr:hypothetical protein Avi_2992 [Allorhizobium ampelinum S4]
MKHVAIMRFNQRLGCFRLFRSRLIIGRELFCCRQLLQQLGPLVVMGLHLFLAPDDEFGLEGEFLQLARIVIVRLQHGNRPPGSQGWNDLEHASKPL